MTPQLEMFSPAHPPTRQEVDWLVERLSGAGWRTAAEILADAGLAATDARKRRLRQLADRSGGRIGGGQLGYKLVSEMTREEFEHTRRWLNHQAEEMKRRVIEMDRVWFARTPVEAGA
jgi:hypothetical protein